MSLLFLTISVGRGQDCPRRCLLATGVLFVDPRVLLPPRRGPWALYEVRWDNWILWPHNFILPSQKLLYLLYHTTLQHAQHPKLYFYTTLFKYSFLFIITISLFIIYYFFLYYLLFLYYSLKKKKTPTDRTNTKKKKKAPSSDHHQRSYHHACNAPKS